MSTTLTKNIPAELNAAVAAVTVIDRPQPTAMPDTPDAPKPPLAPRTIALKRDSFCIRYANLIAKYGDPITYGPKGGIKWNEVIFAAKFAQDVPMLFTPEENRFYVYESATGLWILQSAAWLRIQVYQDMLAFARQEGIDELPFELGDRQLRNLASQMEGITEKRQAFASAHGLIHVTNGMLDLSSGTAVLKPFGENYRSRNQTPVGYDPTATCDQFMNDLLRPALPDADIDLLQRWAGSLLLGGNQAQRIMIIGQGISRRVNAPQSWQATA